MTTQTSRRSPPVSASLSGRGTTTHGGESSTWTEERTASTSAAVFGLPSTSFAISRATRSSSSCGTLGRLSCRRGDSSKRILASTAMTLSPRKAIFR